MLIHTMRQAPARAQGFTLIELMVAVALGLIVSAAVLAFIFSLIRANSETVLSTRLNQELRATLAVISSEVRRARGIQDPISAVGQDGKIDYDNNGVIDAADVDFPKVLVESGGKCVRYAYYDGSSVRYRAIYLDVGLGAVFIVGGATRAAAPCSGGTRLTTQHGVEISGLTFAYDQVTNKRMFSIELTGQLSEPPAYMTQNTAMAITTKTTRQTISIRSNDA